MPCSRTLTFPLSYISGQKVQGHRDTFSIYSTSFLLMHCKWGSCNIISHIPFSFFCLYSNIREFPCKRPWVVLQYFIHLLNISGEMNVTTKSYRAKTDTFNVKKYFLNFINNQGGLCLLAQWWCLKRESK